jgi:hypothetical protein
MFHINENTLLTTCHINVIAVKGSRCSTITLLVSTSSNDYKYRQEVCFQPGQKAPISNSLKNTIIFRQQMSYIYREGVCGYNFEKLD